MMSAPIATWTVVALTTAQLLVATLFPDLPQFDGKAFGSRLVAYPVMMSLPVLVWWLARRRDLPWLGFTLIGIPFLVDVTGNTLDLYDTVVWWDDANHFVNWFFLLTGIGLIIGQAVQPDWALVLLVTGLGAVLAIGWELGEWYTFIRHGTELDTAYEDTLGDESLGTLGALLAGIVVARVRR